VEHDLAALRAGDVLGPAHRRGRRFHNYSVALGGGLFVNVDRDRLTCVGIEPVAAPVVSPAALSPHAWRPLVWVGPLAGAAAAGAAVVTSVALWHRRAA
jgi:hypothetical protein